MPTAEELDHSLLVADALRRIVMREAPDQHAYEVDYHFTARYLRRNGGDRKKKTYVPDLLIGLNTATGEKKSFNFFIDDFGTGRAGFFGKS